MSIDSLAFEINPLQGKKGGRQSDTILEMERPELIPEPYLSLIKKYEEMPERGYYSNDRLKEVDDILTPSQIEKLCFYLFEILPLARKDKWDSPNDTIEITNKLIQNSFDAGYNNFSLRVSSDDNASDSEGLNQVCSNLTGKPLRRMKVRVEGDIGYRFGNHTQFVDFQVFGHSLDDLGDGSMFSTFRVHGNPAGSVGSETKFCVYDIHGNIESAFELADYSIYVIRGRLTSENPHYHPGLEHSSIKYIFFDNASYRNFREAIFREYEGAFSRWALKPLGILGLLPDAINLSFLKMGLKE